MLVIAPDSFAVVSKEQIYSDIDPMIDARDYDGVANYFIKLKNDAYTIEGAEMPYIKGNTLYLPENLTEIGEESFGDDVSVEYYLTDNTNYNRYRAIVIFKDSSQTSRSVIDGYLY